MTNADQQEQHIIYQAKPPNPGYFGSPSRRGRPAGNGATSGNQPDNQDKPLIDKPEITNNLHQAG